jgi:hypothetical protein
MPFTVGKTSESRFTGLTFANPVAFTNGNLDAMNRFSFFWPSPSMSLFPWKRRMDRLLALNYTR